MKTDDLFEAGLAGYMNAQTVAGMLPDVNNRQMFMSAVNKVRLDQRSALTVQEREQLALAFISLLGLGAAQKSTVFKQIAGVQSGTPERAAPATGPET